MNLIAPSALVLKTPTSLLVKAIQHQYIRQVRELLEKGCDPNEPVGPRQIRPLMVACYMKSKPKRLNVFKSLIQHDVNIELVDINGRDCFMYACALTSKEEVKLLLDSKMYGLYSMDSRWNTPLHICARHGNVDVLNFLLQRMAQLRLSFNQRNLDNQTPMDIAILSKNIKCVDALCRMNGDSSYTRKEIACYCKFTGGPSGREDSDRLVFGSLLKYKVNESKSITKTISPKQNYNPKRERTLGKKKSVLVKRKTVSFINVPIDKPVGVIEAVTAKPQVETEVVHPELSNPSIVDAYLPLKNSESCPIRRPKVDECSEKLKTVRGESERPASKLEKQIFKGKQLHIDPETSQPSPEMKSLPKRALCKQGVQPGLSDLVQVKSKETIDMQIYQSRNVSTKQKIKPNNELEDDTEATDSSSSPSSDADPAKNNASQGTRRNPLLRHSTLHCAVQAPTNNLYRLEEEDEDEEEDKTDEEAENDDNDEESFSDSAQTIDSV